MNRFKAPIAVGLAIVGGAAFSQVQVPAGTEVMLRFNAPVSSKTAKAGDKVPFTVLTDVSVNGHLVIHKGEAASGIIETVDKRGRYGKNARIRIAINPIDGIPVEPRDKGKDFAGTRTTEAAAATGGAALIFGPLGLASGYFIVGKSVNVKAGDTLRTVVSTTTGK